jgi:hypothetical protein
MIRSAWPAPLHTADLFSQLKKKSERDVRRRTNIPDEGKWGAGVNNLAKNIVSDAPPQLQ